MNPPYIPTAKLKAESPSVSKIDTRSLLNNISPARRYESLPRVSMRSKRLRLLATEHLNNLLSNKSSPEFKKKGIILEPLFKKTQSPLNSRVFMSPIRNKERYAHIKIESGRSILEEGLGNLYASLGQLKGQKLEESSQFGVMFKRSSIPKLPKSGLSSATLKRAIYTKKFNINSFS